jgi:hypothetical protein
MRKGVKKGKTKNILFKKVQQIYLLKKGKTKNILFKKLQQKVWLHLF